MRSNVTGLPSAIPPERNASSGISGSRLPASAPASIAAPASKATSPSALPRRTTVRACGGSGSMARNSTPEPISKAAHASNTPAGGSTGETIHTATASSSTPKNCFTAFIHDPARGSSAPSDTPTTTSGRPMPKAMTNSAVPPISASRVWPM